MFDDGVFSRGLSMHAARLGAWIHKSVRGLDQF